MMGFFISIVMRMMEMMGMTWNDYNGVEKMWIYMNLWDFSRKHDDFHGTECGNFMLLVHDIVHATFSSTSYPYKKWWFPVAMLLY